MIIIPKPNRITQGSSRVIRGGSWYDYGRYCRSAYRYGNEPTNQSNFLGFRVALRKRDK